MSLLRYDPTRTVTLRNEYQAEMRRRFKALRKLVTEAILDLDVLGLDEREPLSFNQELISNALPERQAWRFQTDAQKLGSFQTWLQQQIDDEILSVDVKGNPWTAKYVDSSYRKGVVRSFNEANKELDEPLGFIDGKRSQFLESSFTQPERLSKLQFLYTRSFEELKGITAAMSQQLSRVLAAGIANGRGARVIARELSNTITGITNKRALVLARTEVISAHAEGQLDSFQELGIERVGVVVEWDTAGDAGVCPLCRPMNGAIFTIEEARGMIPRHPNCRCAWIPAPKSKTNKKKREQTPGKIKRSIKAELPNRTRARDKVPQTVKEAKRRSSWVGKEKVTANVCDHLETNAKWFNNYMEALRDYRN